VVSGGGGQVRVWGLLRGTATRHRGGWGGCAEAAGGAGGDAAKPWVRGGASGVSCQRRRRGGGCQRGAARWKMRGGHTTSL
jgi:hypothetical protein